MENTISTNSTNVIINPHVTNGLHEEVTTLDLTKSKPYQTGANIQLKTALSLEGSFQSLFDKIKGPLSIASAAVVGYICSSSIKALVNVAIAEEGVYNFLGMRTVFTRNIEQSLRTLKAEAQIEHADLKKYMFSPSREMDSTPRSLSDFVMLKHATTLVHEFGHYVARKLFLRENSMSIVSINGGGANLVSFASEQARDQYATNLPLFPAWKDALYFAAGPYFESLSLLSLQVAVSSIKPTNKLMCITKTAISAICWLNIMASITCNALLTDNPGSDFNQIYELDENAYYALKYPLIAVMAISSILLVKPLFNCRRKESSPAKD